ncbi:MAG: hypothetical protein ABJF01_23260 [bacterium]
MGKAKNRGKAGTRRKTAGGKATKFATVKNPKRPKTKTRKTPKAVAKSAVAKSAVATSAVAKRSGRGSRSRTPVMRANVGVAKRAPGKSPSSAFRVRPLDPQLKCGPGTSVQQLFRVDEALDGVTRTHLVYFDRHGWYCEHGRTCIAVAPARRVGDGTR